RRRKQRTAEDRMWRALSRATSQERDQRVASSVSASMTARAGDAAAEKQAARRVVKQHLARSAGVEAARFAAVVIWSYADARNSRGALPEISLGPGVRLAGWFVEVHRGLD